MAAIGTVEVEVVIKNREAVERATAAMKEFREALESLCETMEVKTPDPS